MIRTGSIAETRAAITQLRDGRKTVAFVPTMGALHAGHLALVDEARRRADVVVASVFVNPLQFGANEDLARYPRTLDEDTAALRDRGVALVFVPSVDEMYPSGRVTTVTAAPHDAVFEGAARPGHFAGVLTVVAKLFNIIGADAAVFGQKDLQQLSLVRRMTRDLNVPTEVVAVPTVREPDGLAMSSRNRYLAPDARRDAASLYASLRTMRDRFSAGERDVATLLAVGRSVLGAVPGVAPDYLAIVDPSDFAARERVAPGDAAIVAARVGGTRLIDNIIFEP